MINNVKSPFGPLITAMATPFQEDYSLDFVAIERLISHLVNTGSTALVVNGTTGESPTLEESEQKSFLLLP